MHLLVIEDDPRLGRLLVRLLGALPWVGIAGGVALAVVIGAVAGLYPAIRAARTAPTEALRTA